MHADQPAQTSAPIGLAAAAAERQASAAQAQSLDASSGAEGLDQVGVPAADASGDEWLVAVELALDVLDQLVAKWCPTWEPAAGPVRSAGAQAWARYLATVASAPGPLAQALAFTGMRYGPPLWVGWQARRQAAAEDADRPAS